MKPQRTGIVILAAHLGLVFAVSAKYAIDKAYLPRAVAAAQLTSTSGRYVFLNLCPQNSPANGIQQVFPVRLSVRAGRLDAQPASAPSSVIFSSITGCIMNSISIYIPDGAEIPKRGAKLSVEVIVPENEMPRPLRILPTPGKL